MKPRPIDYKELKQQSLRIRTYSEKQWEKEEHFEPFELAIMVCIAGAIISVGTLLIGIVLYAKYFIK